MDEQLHHSIATEMLRLALQLGSGQIETLLSEQRQSAMPIRARSKDDALRHYRQRLHGLDRGLTSRELDVAARLLAGMTAEGTALELDIKKSSVITYRKRLYERLGICSLPELFHLVA